MPEKQCELPAMYRYTWPVMDAVCRALEDEGGFNAKAQRRKGIGMPDAKGFEGRDDED